MQRGDLIAARAIADHAYAASPKDALLADTAGDLALKAGDAITAELRFREAAQLQPDFPDFALNHAVALQRLGRHRAALTVLAPLERSGRDVPRYASLRGASHRALGEMAQAARWYDKVLVLDPRHAKGLHGRARVALERGEAAAPSRFDRALAANPKKIDLWLGKAQALDAEGDPDSARTLAEQICSQAPTYLPGLEFLSGLLLAAGEEDFTAPFVNAAQKAPQDANIAVGHIATLVGLDRDAQASEVAAAARLRFPNEPYFALQEAVHIGTSGRWDEAEALFAALPGYVPGRALYEARHALRGRDLARAQALLDQVLTNDPWNISGWALRGIAWRLTDDPRAHWLHEQEGLVQTLRLRGPDKLIENCAAELRRLHRGSAMPLGQSLRGGTQTRGILFHRREPVFAELEIAITETLAEYRAGLPQTDPDHPLLRHCDAQWELAGSWSVRLTGGGDHHTAHIHPQGIVSSALYLVVPEAASGPEQEGWLEIGRPKTDLGLDLPPLRTIRPVEGHLALFPSTVYHGTTPFRSAERLTVAFDVVPTGR
ncbi:2OG-Fe(II) oxygenase family protein [Qipengyuania atrilutea]|nr:tetratricopeptide repeat protein [Actirhodobacter atriluteus]